MEFKGGKGQILLSFTVTLCLLHSAERRLRVRWLMSTPLCSAGAPGFARATWYGVPFSTPPSIPCVIQRREWKKRLQKDRGLELDLESLT